MRIYRVLPFFLELFLFSHVCSSITGHHSPSRHVSPSFTGPSQRAYVITADDLNNYTRHTTQLSVVTLHCYAWKQMNFSLGSALIYLMWIYCWHNKAIRDGKYLLAQVFIVSVDRAYKEVSTKKILQFFYGSVFVIWMYLQKAMYRPCYLDLWPMKVKIVQWIENNPISILYKFQIDISSNSREIKYQNIGRTHTQTDRHTDRQTGWKQYLATPSGGEVTITYIATEICILISHKLIRNTGVFSYNTSHFKQWYVDNAHTLFSLVCNVVWSFDIKPQSLEIRVWLPILQYFVTRLQNIVILVTKLPDFQTLFEVLYQKITQHCIPGWTGNVHYQHITVCNCYKYGWGYLENVPKCPWSVLNVQNNKYCQLNNLINQ